MKTEHYNQLEDKYFEGITNSEEEKFLKEQDNDGLFNILKEEKKTTMDWSFDDFMKTVEEKGNKPSIIPLPTSTSKMKNYWWIAAAIPLVVGILFFWNQNQEATSIHNSELIAEEISKQKEIFVAENRVESDEIIGNIDEVQRSTLSNDDDKNKSVISKANEEDILDEILPRKGRLIKQSKPKFTSIQNKINKANNNQFTDEADSYVIINGQKITNKQEALEITQYSLQLVSDKVSKTIANTVALDQNVDY